MEVVAFPRPRAHAAFDLIVLAASAGGVEALSAFLSGLPACFPTPIVAVQHLPRTERFCSHLDSVLDRNTELTVKWAEHGELLRPTTVYLAPQDQQTTIDPLTGLLQVTNQCSNARRTPTADPLFRSAAERFGERTVAVVLSGALQDGADGARVIAEAGGRVLVQTSADAQFPDMPKAAMKSSRVGFAYDARSLADVVSTLVMAPGAAQWFGVGRLGVCA